MRVWSYFLSVIMGLGVVACGNPTLPSGPVQVQVIRPTGDHCRYAIETTALQTLDSLASLSGRIGRVVQTDTDFSKDPTVLQTGVGFRPVSLRFSHSNGVYFPLDYDTLLATSLYFAVETGYLLHSRLSSETDFSRTQPGFGERTFIVHNARWDLQSEGLSAPMRDNAEFLALSSRSGAEIRHFFFAYPTELIRDMPLGLNLGVFVHEYTHLVFHQLFYAKNPPPRSHATEAALGSLDEGIADYFGFLATKDPGFFLCSFPGQNRDLAVPKAYDAALDEELRHNPEYDIHVGGAVFAAINYEIGETIGSHEENARSLQRLIPQLIQCGQAQGSVSLTVPAIANCHASVAGPHSATVQRIYGKYLTAGKMP